MFKNLTTALRAVSLGALVCATATTLAFAQSAAPGPQPSPLRAAFVYVTPVQDTGWTRQHDEGRKAALAAMGSGALATTKVDSVPEGVDAERVIRDLARSGQQIIFTTSFGYMEPTLKVAQDFPNVKFESITGYKTAPNVAVANARYYEGRYLAGIAAGRMSKTGVAGYLAGFPIPEVLQGINAFTLGMRSVNSKAQVKLVWLDTWFDPPREREAAMALLDAGADVLAFHTASNAAMVAAQERGKLAIAYHSDMRKVAPDAQLLAVTHEWGDYYTQRLRALQAGTWKSANTWGGVREGMIRVGDFGARMPAAVQQEVMARQKDMGAGRLHPFHAGSTAVRDNEGHVVIDSGKTLSDAQILGMNWLAEGVQGKISR